VSDNKVGQLCDLPEVLARRYGARWEDCLEAGCPTCGARGLARVHMPRGWRPPVPNDGGGFDVVWAWQNFGAAVLYCICGEITRFVVQPPDPEVVRLLTVDDVARRVYGWTRPRHACT
jgi:hypothetical protein